VTTPSRSLLARYIPWTLIVFLAAFWVPWLGSRYDTFLATQIAINSLFAVSLNLLLGTRSGIAWRGKPPELRNDEALLDRLLSL
jgi:hypothetical protein